MKILAVDDDQIALDILETALKGADYLDVVTAVSAQKALERLLFEEKPFECILLDIRMPEMDGIELCRLLRSMPTYQSTPIIMISALTDQHNIDQAMAAGATDYVTKPFKGLELGARLRAASFLAGTLQKRAADNQQLDELKSELLRLQKHDLETAIALDPKLGAVTDLELENGLLKLAEGVHRLEIMAFACVNIRQVYDTLEPSGFRAFLNSVSDRILEMVDASEVNVAYFGGGTFAVVVKTSRSNGTLETSIRSALECATYPDLGNSNIDPVFVSAKPKHCDYWSAQSAFSGLLDGLRRVQLKCAGQLDQKNLAEYRTEVRRETAPGSTKLWFLNPVLALKDKEEWFKPKRVETSGKSE